MMKKKMNASDQKRRDLTSPPRQAGLSRAKANAGLGQQLGSSKPAHFNPFCWSSNATSNSPQFNPKPPTEDARTCLKEDLEASHHILLTTSSQKNFKSKKNLDTYTTTVSNPTILPDSQLIQI
jgi:hypothetical protein